jgi:hypothetical protein
MFLYLINASQYFPIFLFYYQFNLFFHFLVFYLTYFFPENFKILCTLLRNSEKKKKRI